MKDALLNLVKTYTAEARAPGGPRSQLVVRRLGPDTYPDPAKTSWNDMVSWTVELWFGYGYFQGALVTWTGRWTVPHDGQYEYATVQKDLPLEEAADAFLSNVIPEVQL